MIKVSGFVLLALIPIYAWADPISIFAATLSITGSAAAAGAVATVASFVASYGAVAGLIASNVYGAVAGRRKARKAAARLKAERNANLEDRSITAVSANPPWRIIYGRCIGGGDVLDIITTDKTALRSNGTPYTKPDALKHLIIHIATHEISQVHEVFIEGVPLGPLDANGWVTSGEFYKAGVKAIGDVQIAPGGSFNAGSPVQILNSFVTTGSDLDTQYIHSAVTLSSGNTVINNPSAYTVTVNYSVFVNKSRVRVSIHLGTDTQTVDTYLNSVAPVQWDTSCRLQGIAYAVVTMDLDEPRFQGGILNVTFDTSGRILEDTRTGTFNHSSNNALCIRDFLMSEWGYKCTASEVDTALTNASANACDSLSSFNDFESAAAKWTFERDIESWTTTGSVLSWNPTALRTTSTGVDPVITSPAISVSGGINRAVRARIKRLSGSAWDGSLFYATSGHSYSGGFFKQIAEPIYDPVTGWAEVTWDMSALTAGGSDWISNQILSIRIDLGNSASDIFDIDWVTVGLLYQPTFTCNGSFTTADSREAVLEDLCESMGGFATYGASWGIVAAVWTAPVMDLTGDDLDGQISILQAGAGFDTVFNGIRGQYIGESLSTPSDFDSYNNAVFVAADGEELWTDITLPFTNKKARARNLARIFVERNRDGLVISYPAKLHAFPLVIGDRVRVTSTEYGFVDKTFRVTDWQFEINNVVLLTLQEDHAEAYDLADAATPDPAQNTALPNPWIVSELSGVTAISGANTALKQGNRGIVPRILVQWAAVTDAYIADGTGSIEILWKRNFSGDWQKITVPGDSLSAYITGVDVNDFVVIDVKARNGLGESGPSFFLGHTVQMDGMPRMYRVVAKGANDTQAPVSPTLWDAETMTVLVGAYGRGYMFARLDRATGAVQWFRQYDVYGVGAIGGFNAADLAVDLNASDTSHIVVVWSYDEPQLNRLTSGLEGAMYRCGASRAVFGSPEFKHRSAYILVAIGGCGEGNGFEAYNGQVDNDTNAWCDVSFMIQSKQLIIGGSATPPRSLADHGYYGTFDATTDVRLVATGFCVLQGNNGRKTSASNTWDDSQIYSVDGFTGGALASAVVIETSGSMMYGLNADPTTDTSYISIDYAIYLAAGVLQVYESGVFKYSYGAYAIGDVISVFYDGYRVSYLRNGTVFYQSSNPPYGNVKFHFDSSFYNEASVNGIKLVPLSMVADLETEQLGVDIATDVFTVTTAGPIGTSGGIPVPQNHHTVCTVPVGPYPYATRVRASASFGIEDGVGNPTSCTLRIARMDTQTFGNPPVRTFTGAGTLVYETVLASGASTTIELGAIGDTVSPYAIQDIVDTLMTVEVIKR